MTNVPFVLIQEKKQNIMKENIIRKKAIEKLVEDNWICWYPYKTRWKKEQDIFSVFDLICLKPNERGQFVGPCKIIFIQLTSLSNIRAREKKIKRFLRTNKLKYFPAEVWGYNKKKKEFKIVVV